MRNTFVNTLAELARVNDDIFLLCGDLGYSVLEPFADSFPDRYLNVGIAEQNMTQVAVGLAREGYNVFTYSIGNFPTLRCMEQIRYDVCYHEANVKVVAVGSGYAYGPLGTSHHTTEDIAMLRSIPGMLVTAPGDAQEAAGIARLLSRYKGPAYVRINKAGEPPVHGGSVSIEIGKPLQVRAGEHVAVLSTGAVLESVVHDVAKHGLDWSIYSVPVISNLDPAVLVSMAAKYQHLVTIEEHQLNGGFGSAVLEQMSDLWSTGIAKALPRIHRIGIANEFVGYAGTQSFLRERAGINLTSVLHLSKP